MKKQLFCLMATALCGAFAFGLAACNENPKGDGGDDEPTKLSVYAPDGAPALALASLIADETSLADGFDFDVHVVDATTIATYVTGATPTADFCILPVNAAATVLGAGNAYQMLGTVTNGNLYFLTDTQKGLAVLTPENLFEQLLGKTLGVIQYEQVPGLTLRVVLEQYEIPYALIENNDEAQEGQVNLRNLTAAQIVPATGCDYYLCSEPARTTKIAMTSSSPDPFRAAGSLQELYGGEDGYPQAVLVAKKSVIDGGDLAAVERVIERMEESAAYLASADPATVVSLLDGKRTAGMDASFTVANLNTEVIANCSVRFAAAKDCKQSVLAFLDKFRAIAPATGMPSDDFFYLG